MLSKFCRMRGASKAEISNVWRNTTNGIRLYYGASIEARRPIKTGRDMVRIKYGKVL